MPITSSAKKALRASYRKKVFNASRKEAVKDVVKELRKLATAGKKKEAEALLSKAFQALDKAAKGDTIKKGNASRKKARLSALVSKLK
jgi:small subunit ribosomal protein S20